MSHPSRILELSAQIQHHTQWINDHLVGQGQPLPSWDLDTPQRILEDPEGREHQACLLEATDELQKLVLGPIWALVNRATDAVRDLEMCAAVGFRNLYSFTTKTINVKRADHVAAPGSCGPASHMSAQHRPSLRSGQHNHLRRARPKIQHARVRHASDLTICHDKPRLHRTDQRTGRPHAVLQGAGREPIPASLHQSPVRGDVARGHAGR